MKKLLSNKKVLLALAFFVVCAVIAGVAAYVALDSSGTAAPGISAKKSADSDKAKTTKDRAEVVKAAKAKAEKAKAAKAKADKAKAAKAAKAKADKTKKPNDDGSSEDDSDSEDEEVAEKPAKEEEPVAEKPKVEKKEPKKPDTLKPAILQVVTNFDKADVTVNGLRYPEYSGPGTEDGMVLPAGGPYNVQVNYGGKAKHYTLNLKPFETRLLIVELTGFQGGGAAPVEPKKPAKAKKPEKKETKKEEKKGEKQPGRVTVYSKPPGGIMIDGAKTAEKTPGTVEVENGRHEVQVEYESGEISEKKIVRVRDGSRIKLFFRERKK